MALLRLLSVVAVVPATATSFETDDRPVTKVVNLLKGMSTQLEKEAKEDEEIFDKLTCWCQTNDREKTKAISEGGVRIERLSSKIEAATARIQTLTSEIENHQKDVEEHKQSLADATANREKELAEFNKEEKDVLASISALDSAITVLSKHNPGSFLQRQNLRSIGETLRREFEVHGDRLSSVFSPSERAKVASFVQGTAPQSGEIFGILKQMRETFKANLDSSRQEEDTALKTFIELKAAKEREISAGTEQEDTKSEELAALTKTNEAAKVDRDSTQSTLNADEQFLGNLKDKCRATDKEWAARQEARQEEMEAVSKAIAVLNSDDAHDTFGRTFAPGLLQISESSRARKAAASAIAASSARDPRLAVLATSVRLDAFTRVKEAVDKMIAELLKEKEDEIKQKDFCNDEFHQNAQEIERGERRKAGSEAKIEDLKMEIKDATDRKAALQASIAEAKMQLKRAGEDREQENKEFQVTVADQRETQRLLQAALKVLRKVYGDDSALLQNQANQEPEAPAEFGEYKKSSGSSGVLGLLQQILGESTAMEKETIRAEDEAQRSYEELVVANNKATMAAEDNVVQVTQELATANEDHSKEKRQLASHTLELDQFGNYKNQLHDSCDFVLKNFEVRQTARDEEVEALRQAKSILSGSKFTSDE